MSNRAVVTFDKQPTANSIGVYLHWNGGPESVLAFVKALDYYGIRDSASDPSYQLARFVQIVGNYFGGTLSLGIGQLCELDTHNYDNGLYRVTRAKGALLIEQCDGKAPYKWHDLSNDSIMRHEYWKDDAIMLNIREKNDAAFGIKTVATVPA